MKWQPIETAPTDGTRILLRGMGGKIADGHYGQPDGYANPKQFVWPYIHANPTHWRPLPEPPESAAAPAQADRDAPVEMTIDMTAERAAYFIRRFRSDEKMLGPNEKSTIDYVLGLLAAQSAPVELPLTGLKSPHSIAVDRARTVYVTDRGNNRVVLMTADQTQRTLGLDGLAEPSGIAVDARGVISVTERQAYILRVRELAKGCCEAWLAGGG